MLYIPFKRICLENTQVSRSISTDHLGVFCFLPMRQHHLADTLFIESRYRARFHNRFWNSWLNKLNVGGFAIHPYHYSIKYSKNCIIHILLIFFTLTCTFFKLFKRFFFLLKAETTLKKHLWVYNTCIVFYSKECYDKLFRLLKRKIFNHFFKYCK